MSKGSKRRKEDTARVHSNWDNIKWNSSKEKQTDKKTNKRKEQDGK